MRDALVCYGAGGSDELVLRAAVGGGSADGSVAPGPPRRVRFRSRRVSEVVPATRGVYLAALREGLLETLVEAGAVIFPPSAGSNQAVNMGAMSEGQAMLSNQARNFPGRNGHPKARHYLASSATIAASVLSGRITDPRSNL